MEDLGAHPEYVVEGQWHAVFVHLVVVEDHEHVGVGAAQHAQRRRERRVAREAAAQRAQRLGALRLSIMERRRELVHATRRSFSRCVGKGPTLTLAVT